MAQYSDRTQKYLQQDGQTSENPAYTGGRGKLDEAMALHRQDDTGPELGDAPEESAPEALPPNDLVTDDEDTPWEFSGDPEEAQHIPDVPMPEPPFYPGGSVEDAASLLGGDGLEIREVDGKTNFSDPTWKDDSGDVTEILEDGVPIQFGKPTGVYTSGATITMDPCDSAGTDNGVENTTVQAGWTLPTNTNIATTTIVPFVQAADGNYYIVGQDPVEVISTIQYDTTTHKIQKKVIGDFGTFTTTVASSWADITTAVNCTT